MRRDTWLTGLVGVIVGSWLTLIVVQLEEHGLGALVHGPHAAADKRASENPPPAKPAETARADVTPPKTEPDGAETAAKPEAVAPTGETAASETQQGQQAGAAPSATVSAGGKAASQPVATPASTSEDAAKAAVGSTAETSGQTQAAKPQDATAAATTPSTGNPSAVAKTAQADAATKPGDDASAKPAPDKPAPDKPRSDTAATDQPPADQAKTDQLPSGRMPADQIDREAARAAHAVAPPQQPAGETPSDNAAKADIDAAQKPVELVRPFADSAGVLTIAGKSVQLAGVVPTAVDRNCTGPSGKSWPCGVVARTAFRMYLRGRTIDCDLPSPTWQGTVTGACRYVRVDLSEWLVRFGWAEPEPGSPLSALAEQARDQKRGIYGDDPRKGGKSTLGPAPIKENPLNPI